MGTADLPTDRDPRLVGAYEVDRVCTGLTTGVDGRCFVSFPSADGPGVQVAEVAHHASPRPYPDESWNAVRDDHDPAGAFVSVNGLRIGPDGHLWIIDSGAPGLGRPSVPGGARLIVVDTAVDEVIGVHDLGPATREGSYIDDIRFNGDLVYVADGGAPGLIVLDRRTGGLRRVLDNHPGTVDGQPMRTDTTVPRGSRGGEVRVHANQLEVSPDGEYLYFQPPSAPMSRIGTRWLDDADLPADTLADHVEPWLETPTTGGTAIDSDGIIYLGDVDRRRILRIHPDRRIDTLIADPRLVWSDAMWLDFRGSLWVPAARLNRTAELAGGEHAAEYSIWIYKIAVGAAPPAIDHD
jgi:sugar lactone lactonase YvrE